MNQYSDVQNPVYTLSPQEKYVSDEHRLVRKEASAYLKQINYQRYPKPPYSYVGMITYAIYLSPEQSLTLSEIKQSFENMFEFFRQDYTGWKDSVRHNLSHNSCFIKGERSNRKGTKGNLWHVDLSKVPLNAFKRQDTMVAKTGNWALDLHVELNVSEIIIPPKTPVPSAVPSAESVKTTPQTRLADVSDNESSFIAASDAEELDEKRHVPPYFLDSSIDESITSNAGPMRVRGSVRKNLRRSEVISQRDQRALMKMISSTAKSTGITDNAAVQNLNMLCNVSSLVANATPPEMQYRSAYQHLSPSAIGPLDDPYMRYQTSPYSYQPSIASMDRFWYPYNPHPSHFDYHHLTSSFAEYRGHGSISPQPDSYYQGYYSVNNTEQQEIPPFYPLSIHTSTTNNNNEPVDYRTTDTPPSEETNLLIPAFQNQCN